MPRRDEEKRIAFLRTLAVEDLANRRITEHSSELEKRMVHDARDAMEEKNDARYMTRHKKKAAVDIVKTQFNGLGRRAQTEVFGREGGLTGGMVGSWLIGGTLAAGTVAGIMSRGKFGAAANGVKTIGRLTRGRIDFLNKASLTNKATDAFIPILKRAKKGKLSREDRIWLKKKSDFYENKAKNSLPFEKDLKTKNQGLRGNPNVSPKAEQPVPSNTPVTQASQKAGDPKRTNPNVPAMSPLQKDALSKLTKGKRLTKEEYVLLRQLSKDGKLTKTQQSLLTARRRKSKRSAKAEPSQPVAAPTPP